MGKEMVHHVSTVIRKFLRKQKFRVKVIQGQEKEAGWPRQEHLLAAIESMRSCRVDRELTTSCQGFTRDLSMRKRKVNELSIAEAQRGLERP